MNTVVGKALFNSHPYEEYRKAIDDLLLKGLSTGKEQSEELTNYSSLNVTRMNRLDKTIKISDENIQKLKNLKREYIWLVISEGWCGDAAQILPVINKMAVATDRVELKIVYRDDNEEFMNMFLTNNSKSIPILVIIDQDTGSVINSWGPRPTGASKLIIDYKKKFGAIDETAKTDLQMWYLHDKGLSIQNEIIDLLTDFENK